MTEELETINRAMLVWKTIKDQHLSYKEEAYAYLGYALDDAECPFCHYVNAYHAGDCRKCPAVNEWTPYDPKKEKGTITCMQSKEYDVSWCEKRNPQPMIDLIQILADKHGS